MSKKETNGVNFGEISTIRNILMGQQMDDYDGRFKELKEHIEQVETSINTRLTELEEKQAAQNEALQNTFTTKLDHLEKILLQNIQEVKTSSSEHTIQERQNLAQLLAEMSDRLLKK